ncbi:MAG: Rap1a/Tai family immunity protein [Geminicoccaceae bacterium]|jgi:Rap1a immunity proteins
MGNKHLALAAAFAVLFAVPASAATFGELVQWCAPEDAGGRPGLCSGYLETYLGGLASTNASLNDGVRACVPESEDRATIRALIQEFARSHPESLPDSGVAGLGQALKDRYPCA